MIGIIIVKPRPPTVLSTQASDAISPSPGATLGAPNWAMMEPMAMSRPPPMTKGSAAETPAMRCVMMPSALVPLVVPMWTLVVWKSLASDSRLSIISSTRLSASETGSSMTFLLLKRTRSESVMPLPRARMT